MMVKSGALVMCEYKTAADESSTWQRLSVYRENCGSYLTTYEVEALAVALFTLKKNLAAASGCTLARTGTLHAARGANSRCI
jgi:glutaminase